MNREKLIEELSPFSDIGEPAPKVVEKEGKFTLRMIRDARPLRVIMDSQTGKVQTTWGTAASRNHASVSAMLASDIFANLKRWADAQHELLKRDLVSQKKLIPINGITHDLHPIRTVDDADMLLGTSSRAENATEILLIDGPAGIGKTNLIEQLALLRAAGYKASPRPLILHVKSRGRVLSNIQDLMAFSLQTIRSNITYDQIPILVRYGLIVVAIDGFDELGDPNGYELAWGQLGELVNFIRGEGTIILSGRDTFMGRSRLIKDVHAIKKDIDIVTGLTLDVPTPNQARAWLKGHQWTDQNFELASISVLFEEGSFALRPVFLKLLAENIKPKQLREKPENYLTSMLVRHMVEREAKLFGRAVESQLDKNAIEKFVFEFMCEAARDMADSQTESLDANSLAWIAETALGDGYAAEIVGLIKNRAGVIAFLIPDERQGYKKFINSQLMNFFLSCVTINALRNGDVPKYLRRNLLGSEFLSTFIDVAAEEASTADSKLPEFWDNAVRFSQRHTYVDRGVRNIGALLFSTLPYLPADGMNIISDFQIDEVVMRGTSLPAKITDVMISQADFREADLSALNFEAVNIVSLIGDDASRFPSSFPSPKFITDSSGRQISDNLDIESWLDARGRKQDESIAQGLATVALRKHPIYKLLGRVLRGRQYWLRAEDDLLGTKIFQDPNWGTLKDVLNDHGFLREEIRQASGRPSAFVHIRQRERILSENREDEDLVKFFKDLGTKI